MEEFVAYSEVANDTLVPLVATLSADRSTVQYRDLVKNDVMHIIDDEHADHPDGDEHPMLADPLGGWLFKNSGINKTSFHRRYALLKGGFIFFFHGPTNDKPVACIPLIGCKMKMPDEGAKTFEKSKIETRADVSGFEFEILSVTRNPVRMHCATEEERILWVEHCEERIEHSKSISNGGIQTLPKPKKSSASSITTNQKIVVTTTRVAPPNADQEEDPIQFDDKFASETQTLASRSTLTPSMVTMDTTKYTRKTKDSSQKNQKKNSIVKAEDDARKALEEQRKKEDEEKELQIREEIQKKELIAREKQRWAKELEEAKKREEENPLTLAEQIRFQLFFLFEQMVDDPDPNQQGAFRMPHPKGLWPSKMLTAVYQNYCSPSGNGFMTYHDYCEFFEDSGIIASHVPRDENNQPIQSFVDALEPTKIIKLIPRELGFSKDILKKFGAVEGDTTTINDDISEMSEDEDMSEDKRFRMNLSINFSQFYFMLGKIAEIVYSDLFKGDETVAMNKILLEVILPMYAWTQDHCRKGCIDPLLKEPRVHLVFSTYAPNLWKVFLMYAQDLNGKMSSLNQPFPEVAKCSERALFGMPFGVNAKQSDLDTAIEFNKSTVGGITNFSADSAFIMTKLAVIKFCRDYGIVPHLVSKKTVSNIFNVVNRDKSTTKKKKVTTFAPACSYFPQDKKPAGSREKPKVDDKIIHNRAMFFGGVNSGYHMYHSTDSPTSRGQKLTGGDFSPVTGIGFSEFIELLGKVALQGLKQEHYHALFPSTFGKVLALLTVWCVADLSRLEDVRAVNAEHS